jgi:hypothetical protein
MTNDPRTWHDLPREWRAAYHKRLLSYLETGIHTREACEQVALELTVAEMVKNQERDGK